MKWRDTELRVVVPRNKSYQAASWKTRVTLILFCACQSCFYSRATHHGLIFFCAFGQANGREEKGYFVTGSYIMKGEVVLEL